MIAISTFRGSWRLMKSLWLPIIESRWTENQLWWCQRMYMMMVMHHRWWWCIIDDDDGVNVFILKGVSSWAKCVAAEHQPSGDGRRHMVHMSGESRCQVAQVRWVRSPWVTGRDSFTAHHVYTMILFCKAGLGLGQNPIKSQFLNVVNPPAVPDFDTFFEIVGLVGSGQ